MDPGELVGYSPWGCKEWDTTEATLAHTQSIDMNSLGLAESYQRHFCPLQDCSPVTCKLAYSSSTQSPDFASEQGYTQISK